MIRLAGRSSQAARSPVAGSKRLLDLAVSVVTKSDREYPADDVLRLELKRSRLPRRESATVSQMVFDYFRWRGWLDDGSIRERIERAAALAARYSTDPRSFSDAELLARAVPGWLSAEMRVTPAFLRAIQSPPKLWLRARPGQRASLSQALRECRPHPVCGDALEYLGPEDLFRTAEFHKGLFEVQDLSSQAVGLACAPQPGETWWDACAGEGGKTLHLSDLMANKGLIWATDRAEWRLQKLRRRAARAGAFNYRVRGWSGSPKLPFRARFDGVLVDAPCSGVGTWHRNPQARWTTAPEDVLELQTLQRQLLRNAAAAVKPGGRLIYSVCTLTRKETLDLLELFEADSPGFERLPIQDPLRREPEPAQNLCLWPQECGSNGMFIAAWRKR